MNEILFRLYTVTYKIKRYIRLWRDALSNAWIAVNLSDKYDELFFEEHVKQRNYKIDKKYWHTLNTIDYYLFLIKYSNSQLLKKKFCNSKQEHQLSEKHLFALISYCESEIVRIAEQFNQQDEIDNTYKNKIVTCQNIAESIRKVIFAESNLTSDDSN